MSKEVQVLIRFSAVVTIWTTGGLGDIAATSSNTVKFTKINGIATTGQTLYNVMNKKYNITQKAFKGQILHEYKMYTEVKEGKRKHHKYYSNLFGSNIAFMFMRCSVSNPRPHINLERRLVHVSFYNKTWHSNFWHGLWPHLIVVNITRLFRYTCDISGSNPRPLVICELRSVSLIHYGITLT